jgi:5S rRNA maturation endonuclease (ribonuclease M5)
VTEEQIVLLGRKKIKRAIILFDQDASAKGEALAYSITSVVQHVECVFLNEGDPDDLLEDDVWELRRELFQGEKI